MKVAFLTPNWNLERNFFPTDTLRPPPSFPIEWGYIVSSLKHTQMPFCLLDEYAQGASFSETIYRLSLFSPEIVVVSSTPSYLFWRCPPLSLDLVSRYVSLIRRVVPQAILLIIGPHGTIDPTWTLSKTHADLVFRGEPDYELPMLLKLGKMNAFLDSPWVARVDKDGEVASQLDFEQIGTVDYGFLIYQDYRPHAWGQQVSQYLWSLAGNRAALIESSRGCSFNCPYCLRTGFRNRYRYKPIKMLISEVEQLKSLDVRYVFFIDETFGLSWKHTYEVMQLVNRAGIKYGIQTRPDILNDEKIEALHSTGCVYIELGVEANEKGELAKLGKFSNIDIVYEIITRLQQTIPFVNRNILDLTNEDYIKFNRNIVTHQEDNSGNPPPPFMPYPTTPFGDQALEHYRKQDESSWEVSEDLYILYSLISRYKLFRQLLHKNRFLRRIFRRGIRYMKHINIARGDIGRSRFESLFDGRDGNSNK